MTEITSVTLHTTGEGQRISYTYSVIDEQTYQVISENNRETLVVPKIYETENVLQAISAINDFVMKHMGV